MNTGPKFYAIESAGIGYDKNVDAVSECLRTQCARTTYLPDVPRRALAQIIWSMVCPSGVDGMIRFNDEVIDSARNFLVNALRKV